MLCVAVLCCALLCFALLCLALLCSLCFAFICFALLGLAFLSYFHCPHTQRVPRPHALITCHVLAKRSATVVERSATAVAARGCTSVHQSAKLCPLACSCNTCKCQDHRCVHGPPLEFHGPALAPRTYIRFSWKRSWDARKQGFHHRVSKQNPTPSTYVSQLPVHGAACDRTSQIPGACNS